MTSEGQEMQSQTTGLQAVAYTAWLDSECFTAAASGAAEASQRRQGCDDSSLTKRKVDQSWFNAKSVEYNTPDKIYDPLDKEFGFTLDVASTHENAKCVMHYTQAEDGLKQDWSGVCWMNPPYGRVMQKWVRKAHAEWKRGATVVALIPARTNTGWWHDCVQDIATVRFIRGEVAFKGFKRGLWMPMCVVIWRGITSSEQCMR